MKRAAIAIASGALFGAGLTISGMTDPARVRSFLDLTGQWDPTLAFVMGGAMLPMALAWLIQGRIAQPLGDTGFNLPETRKLDWKLALGAGLFGVGWGLGGLCPGPAIASLSLAPMSVAPFLIAMLGGMALHRFTTR